MTSDQIIRFIQAPEKLNQETLPQLKELIEQFPSFEAGWILYLKNLKNLNHPSFSHELIQGAIHIHDRRKLYVLLNEKTGNSDNFEITQPDKLIGDNLDILNLILPAEYQIESPEFLRIDPAEKENARTPVADQKTNLIEKFLEAQPKMPPIKENEETNPLKSAEKPDEDSDELVTETLASIYAKQGYYKRAIQIFEKLSLKYPEKSSYFAGHIEKIKNLMNN